MKITEKLMPLVVLFIIMITGYNVNINAQDATGAGSDEIPERQVHSLGAAAGFTTGYGLSYRYRPGKFGVQLNAAPYFDEETSRHSVGLTLLYTLIENRSSNLYMYQGNHFYYNSYIGYNYDPMQPSNPGTRQRYTESYLNNGLGFGIELIVAKRVGINIMAGYAFYENFKKLNVTGEAGLYYKF